MLDVLDLGAHLAIFYHFLTNFLPLRPPNILKLLKNHTAISVSIIYNHSYPSGMYQDRESSLWLDFLDLGAHLVIFDRFLTIFRPYFDLEDPQTP